MFEKEYATLKVTVEDKIAQVVLSSPPVNTLTPELINDIEAAFDELAAAEDVRAVILSSAFPKVFVAGADIKAFQFMGAEENMAVSRRGGEVYNKVENFPAPVICVVEGVAFGGGLELALACDIRIFGEKAKVGLPEVSLGITPGYGGSQRLPHIVGEGQAKRMIYTGATVRADEAYRIGLAQQVVPMGEGVNAALEMAKTIANHAPLAVAAVKRCIHASRGDREAGMAYETEMAGYTFTTEDKVEGMTAFIEKRPAEFKRR